MRYVAELTRDQSEELNGEKLSIGTKDFEAKDDNDAISQATAWAVIELSQMLDTVVHLQVVQDARGVHSRTFGGL
jgi:hypothetical protein